MQKIYIDGKIDPLKTKKKTCQTWKQKIKSPNLLNLENKNKKKTNKQKKAKDEKKLIL